MSASSHPAQAQVPVRPRRRVTRSGAMTADVRVGRHLGDRGHRAIVGEGWKPSVSQERPKVRVLVVYESMFGNTRDVALAIADGLGTRLSVDVTEVGVAPTVLPPDVAMVVIGAPTHAHGMTTPSSREDAARRAGERLVSRGSGIREWLGSLQPSDAPIPAVVFDTRIKGPGLLWGSAAKSAAKLLAGAGLRLVDAPQSFLVGGPTGEPFDRLEDGELERARAWGVELSSSAPAAAVRTG